MTMLTEAELADIQQRVDAFDTDTEEWSAGKLALAYGWDVPCLLADRAALTEALEWYGRGYGGYRTASELVAHWEEQRDDSHWSARKEAADEG